MIITKVEVQQKHKDRVNIYVDGEFFCGMTLFACMKYRLKEGLEIDRERLEFLRTETERESACEKGVKYVSKTQKTEKEMRDHLYSKGFEKDAVEYAIKKLKQYDYINDELYAKNFVRYKSKTDGKKKIEYELKTKGISPKIINDTLADFDFDDGVVRSLAEKYLKGKTRDIKTKQKAYRYLASRGFSSSEILSAISPFFSEE